MTGLNLGSLPAWLLILAPKLITAAFLFAFGAAVGSFLNVVVYRVPAGRSVVSPPSRCPSCGWRLSWRENLPILGWLFLRGRCRRCRGRISIQYPLIEAVVGAIFATTYLMLYVSAAGGWWENIGGPWWRVGGFGETWPAFAVLMTMIAGLVAATLVDARTFLIPAGITNVVGIVAIIGWGLQGLLPAREAMVLLEAAGDGPLPGVGWPVVGLVSGATIGNIVALVLLRRGILTRSFADYEEYVTDDEPLADYPHGRREMVREMAFLLPIISLGLLGWWLCSLVSLDAGPPRVMVFLASSALGYFVGAAIVWAIRILGTLAFGREAMGMGDVHLLAVVGATLGWLDPIRIFFIAPFLALAWIAGGRILSRFGGRTERELPYGPHLAAATLLVIYARPWIDELQTILFFPSG
ncbi:MAG: hypothetical protein CMJ23_14560 [Phycisphaerae bacterium]|nr:hypothetical protein [Phycisphaerae bacterium]